MNIAGQVVAVELRKWNQIALRSASIHPFQMTLSVRSYELPPENIELIQVDLIRFMSTESYKLQNYRIPVVYGDKETCHQIILYHSVEVGNNVCCFSLWGSPRIPMQFLTSPSLESNRFVGRWTFLVPRWHCLRSFHSRTGKETSDQSYAWSRMCRLLLYHELEHIETTFSATHRDYLLFAPA